MKRNESALLSSFAAARVEEKNLGRGGAVQILDIAATSLFVRS